MARRLAGAKQKSVGQARQRTAEATRTAEVTEVGDIAYLHGVPADRGSGAEDDTPPPVQARMESKRSVCS